MNVLDLFSGIGGFSLGLERAGMRTVAFCEIDPFCREVLAERWPGVEADADITKREFREGEAEIICGGFPCQDISLAGDGAGLAGERSGLWRELLRAIRVVRPRYAIVENVAALLSRGMGTVLGDLAEIGADAEWHCIPARAVGAPHLRDRVWIIADTGGEQHEGYRAPFSGTIAQELSEAYLANACRDGYGADYRSGENPGAARGHQGEGDQRQWLWSEPRGGSEALADADREREPQSQGVVADFRRRVGDSGSQEPAHSDREGLQASGSEPARAHGRNAGREPSAGGWWSSEPDVGRVAHGVPGRVDRLKALGNSVVPQIPEIIGRAIMKAHTQTSA